MRLLLPLVVALAALPAWATGERIVLAPAAAPLHDALCVSMRCVSGGPREATVAARRVRGAVEFVVTDGRGRLTLVQRTPLLADGRIGAVDLAHAATAVVRAIESPAPARPVASRPRHRRPAAAVRLARR